MVPDEGPGLNPAQLASKIGQLIGHNEQVEPSRQLRENLVVT